ncbi:hypothetical protein AYO22_04539 [Fonsecaea multimorphosa]|nr:hypothetical protein AYO22_04539 [Fonsecaea multimorphosa]
MATFSSIQAQTAVGSGSSQKRKATMVEPAPRRRTPQACLIWRKSKCDGVRPSCRNCRRLNRSCEWPDPEATGVDSVLEELSEIQHRILLDAFFSTSHLEPVRLSIHKPTFDGTGFQHHPEFFRLAICTLAALYLDHDTSVKYFEGDSPWQISERLAPRVRQLARDTSDQPTVKNIQANLILALRELVARAGYNSYIYAGFAIRMAHSLRFMKEYHHRHPPLEREIRRRCMWSCVVVDILISLTLCRPTSIQTQWTYIQLPCPEASFMFGEDYPSPTLAEFVHNQPDHPDLLPYFIKAVDILNTMMEHVRAWVVQDQSLDLGSEYTNPFDTTFADWISQLPDRMSWSKHNLRAFRLLGQGNLFVTFHMVVSHAFCLVPQLYLPYTGMQTAPSPVPLSDRQITAIRKCLHHADRITAIVSLLFRGDDVAREILRSPFTSLAMMCAATIHIWSAHSEACVKAATPNPTGSAQSTPSTPPNHHLRLFVEVFQSWEKSWPLAHGCLETISFLEQLYNVAYHVTAAPLEDGNMVTEAAIDLDRTAAVGSGIYDPPAGPFMLSRWTQVLLAVQSEPQPVKKEQARAQLRALCRHLRLRSMLGPVSTQEDDGAEDGYEFLSHFDTTELEDLGGFVGCMDGSTDADVDEHSLVGYISFLHS